MRDRTVGDTFYMFFTTRAFATGIPTVLAGTPVVSAYEDNSATQITAGITLGVSHDSVVGLNLLTVVATGGNGYETGKDYSFVITTGTVGGVSVVGEVVGEFSLSLSAAAVDLANGTDGLTALKTSIDGVPTTAEFDARTLPSANYFDPSADTVANVTLVATTTTNTDMRGTDSANTVVPPSVAQFNARTILAADYFDPAADAVANVTLCATTTTNTDMRGTDGANTTVPDAAGVAPTAVEIRQEMDSNSIDLDAIQSNQTTINSNVLLIDTAPMRGTDSAFLAASAPTNFSALGINVGGDISVVTLVDTTTANTDMRGTDSALLAASINLTGGAVDTVTDVTNDVGITQAGADKVWVSSSRTLTDGIQKNTAFNNLEFLMVLTSDHVTPATGLTVTGERSLDGGAFGAVTGTIAEVSNGIYQVDLLSADTNGDVITYRFSSGTADDTFITVTTA